MPSRPTLSEAHFDRKIIRVIPGKSIRIECKVRAKPFDDLSFRWSLNGTEITESSFPGLVSFSEEEEEVNPSTPYHTSTFAQSAVMNASGITINGDSAHFAAASSQSLLRSSQLFVKESKVKMTSAVQNSHTVSHHQHLRTKHLLPPYFLKFSELPTDDHHHDHLVSESPVPSSPSSAAYFSSSTPSVDPRRHFSSASNVVLNDDSYRDEQEENVRDGRSRFTRSTTNIHNNNNNRLDVNQAGRKSILTFLPTSLTESFASISCSASNVVGTQVKPCVFTLIPESESIFITSSWTLYFLCLVVLQLSSFPPQSLLLFTFVVSFVPSSSFLCLQYLYKYRVYKSLGGKDTRIAY